MSQAKTGISLGPLVNIHDLMSCSRIADEYKPATSIWVPESWGRESFSTLGAMAQQTRRVDLGTSIISMYSRTPATVAMGAVSIDAFSGGRAIVGIGASTEAIVEGLHGARFERPVQRMREYVTCVRLLTSGERTNFEGEFFRIRNFKLLEKPTRSKIPLYVAAVNEKMISTATELADGIILYLRPLDEIPQTVDKIRASFTSKSFEIALSIICSVSDANPHMARQRARMTLAFYIAVGKYYRQFLAKHGFEREAKEVQNAYNASGAEAASSFVSDYMLDSLTISGTSRECSERLTRFRSTGITLPILQFNPIVDAESSFREMLSIF